VKSCGLPLVAACVVGWHIFVVYLHPVPGYCEGCALGMATGNLYTPGAVELLGWLCAVVGLDLHRGRAKVAGPSELLERSTLPCVLLAVGQRPQQPVPLASVFVPEIWPVVCAVGVVERMRTHALCCWCLGHVVLLFMVAVLWLLKVLLG
jgi:hypothetical protein